MRKTLKPHQEAGVQYVRRQLAHGKAAYLWMEMRTGKTLTAIRALEGEPGPLLVLCPRTVLATWQDELMGDGVSPHDILVLDGTTAKVRRLAEMVGKVRWTLANWEKVWRYRLLDASRAWGVIVADESRKLANNTKATKYCLDHRHGEKRVLLSGAPASEGSTDLVGQYLWGDGRFMGYGDWWGYMKAHYIWDERRYRWRPKLRNHEDSVRSWVHLNSYGVKMADVWGDGERKLYVVHRLEPDKAQNRLLATLRHREGYRNRDTGEGVPYTPLTRALHERQICAGFDPYTADLLPEPKTAHVVAMAQEGEYGKMLVLSEFLEPLRRLKEALYAAGVPFVAISGEDSTQDREDSRRRFQACPEVRVAVCQTRTVYMGLRFDAADSIVYLSNGYSQDVRTQSEERATSMDKRTPVQIVDLVVAGTIEPAVLEVLRRKQDVSSAFIESWYAQRKETKDED